MVVDEGQDMREGGWPALLALHTDPDDGLLYVFADDHQNLYGGALPIPDEDRVGPIPHNLRNTKQIGEFVSVFYEGPSEEEGIPREDIAVLTPSGSNKSRLRALGSVNGFRLSETVEPGTVLATSVHAFKGLERPVGVLAALGGQHLEDPN